VNPGEGQYQYRPDFEKVETTDLLLTNRTSRLYRFHKRRTNAADSDGIGNMGTIVDMIKQSLKRAPNRVIRSRHA